MIRPAALLVVVALAAAGPLAVAAPHETLVGKVVSVHDGDTLTLRTDGGETIKVRLYGIDAPEIGQAFGTRSREALAGMTLGRPVAVDVHGQDKYRRTIGAVVVGGVDVNVRLVAEGLAWHYARFDATPELAGAEKAARSARKGLWSDPAPVAPWEWRAGEAARRKAKKAAAGTGAR